MTPKEKIGEVVRVGLGVLGIAILLAAAVYIGLQLHIAWTQWAVRQ